MYRSIETYAPGRQRHKGIKTKSIVVSAWVRHIAGVWGCLIQGPFKLKDKKCKKNCNNHFLHKKVQVLHTNAKVCSNKQNVFMSCKCYYNRGGGWGEG